MSSESSRIWLHRLSHYGWVVAYELAEKGYLTIGYSDAVEAADYPSAFRDPERCGAAYEEIARGYGASRAGCLSRFAQMSEGDLVVVPRPGCFDVYKVLSDTMEDIRALPLEGAINDTVSHAAGDWLKSEKEPDGLDLGYFRRVEVVRRDISRELAPAALVSRLKARQSTLDISDLAQEVETAIARAQQEAAPTALLNAQLAQALYAQVDAYLREECTPERLERLVARYFEAEGARVVIPTKTASYHAQEAKCGDVDVFAYFDIPKVAIAVQVKRHHDNTETDGWAVSQVIEGAESFARAPEHEDWGIRQWVISTADDFTAEAKALAKEKGVTLLARKDFVEAFVDAVAPTIQEF